MADPRKYHFDLPAAGRPDHAPIAEEWYPGIKSAALATSRKRKVDAIKGIRAVVIHATAGSSSAGAASVTFDGNASFHWLIPDENEAQHGAFVWATCHEARAAFHVRSDKSHPAINSGKTDVNHWSLGIELVNAQVGSDSFSDWQVQAAADLVRYAWAKYPNLTHVVSHAMLDPGRRSDPGTLFPWDDFRVRVLSTPEVPTPDLMTALPEAVLSPEGSCCMGA